MPEPENKDNLPLPIVFYDGQCGLCSRSVQWFVKRDKHHNLHFAPLQGQTAAEALTELSSDPMSWSVVLRDSAGIHQHSDAAIRAVAHMGGLWVAVKPLLILPRLLRDWAYRFIARNRYRWFGQHDACWLGDEQTRSRMLP